MAASCGGVRLTTRTKVFMKRLVESFGRAPIALLVLAVVSALAVVATRAKPSSPADLVVAVFAPSHLAAYEKALPAFERAHGVRVELQLNDWHALENRLQNAMLSDSEVPDMVELIEGSLGFFTRGPVSDVGFMDLGPKIRADGLDEDIVSSRFSLWTAHGRIYALPHDVHPVMLVYRKDLVDALGIDVRQLNTWDDFVHMGQRVTRDLDGDGSIDRYALDLPLIGGTGLSVLLLQRGVQFFDADGKVAFDVPATAETMRWYAEQTRGKDRIAFDCGWGQPLMKAMTDGLSLFYLAADWRTRVIQKEIPKLHGKLAVMPLPAWEPGGRRTSVWGGTGMAISKRTKHPELAWKLAKHLYADRSQLGERFRATHVIPPFRSAFSLPDFAQPMPYYGGQAVGREFAALAPSTPPFYSSAVHRLALSKIDQAYAEVAEHFDAHGRSGLDEEAQRAVTRAAEYVRRAAARTERLQTAHAATGSP